jgi:hypothetical protein
MLQTTTSRGPQIRSTRPNLSTLTTTASSLHPTKAYTRWKRRACTRSRSPLESTSVRHPSRALLCITGRTMHHTATGRHLATDSACLARMSTNGYMLAVDIRQTTHTPPIVMQSRLERTPLSLHRHNTRPCTRYHQPPLIRPCPYHPSETKGPPAFHPW